MGLAKVNGKYSAHIAGLTLATSRLSQGQTLSLGGGFGYQVTYDSSTDADWPSYKSDAFSARVLASAIVTLQVHDAYGNDLPSSLCQLVESNITQSQSAIVTYDYTPVPEPSSILALVCGLIGMGGVARRRR